MGPWLLTAETRGPSAAALAQPSGHKPTAARLEAAAPPEPQAGDELDRGQRSPHSVPTLLSSGRLQADGFPAPLSAGPTRLYDGEQVDGDLAGRPVPALPTVDDDEDLLDLQEAAVLSGIPVRMGPSQEDPGCP
ncbi:hypothetical protein ACIPM2_31865 [Streptomyces sp. NPDC086081]|uniref:hypothetical protein n=1 Tax=Streptomyces sp. NPDC086081 TaxID=3365749 RepID=UPI003816EF84